MSDEPQLRKRLPPFAMLASDLYSNRKIRKARALGAQVFVFALLKNAEHGRSGSFPATELEDWYLAEQLMLTEEQAREGLARAIDAGLLEIRGEHAMIVGWDEGWARRSLTESEARMLRRKATPSLPEKQKEKKRESNTKSSPELVRTESGQSPDTSRRRSAGPLSDGWIPNAGAIELGMQLGIDPHREAQKFRDHALGKGRKQLDWDAAFRLWLRNAAEWKSKPSEPERPRMIRTL